MMAAAVFSTTGSSAWNAARAAARVSGGTGHLADADAARLELQLDGPERPEHRRFSIRHCREYVPMPVGCPLPCSGEVLLVQVADAVVRLVGAGFAFTAAIMQDLLRVVAREAFVVVMR